jgi:hypothetical protein
VYQTARELFSCRFPRLIVLVAADTGTVNAFFRRLTFLSIERKETENHSHSSSETQAARDAKVISERWLPILTKWQKGLFFQVTELFP